MIDSNIVDKDLVDKTSNVYEIMHYLENLPEEVYAELGYPSFEFSEIFIELANTKDFTGIYRLEQIAKLFYANDWPANIFGIARVADTFLTSNCFSYEEFAKKYVPDNHNWLD